MTDTQYNFKGQTKQQNITMDLSNKPFLDYNDENIPVSLDIIPGHEFYSTSPDYSESTSAKNTHSLSPEVQGYLHTTEQFPMENWTYAENYLLQGLEDSQYGQTPQSNETEEKICKKSKRISKRAVAKERTKTKQEVQSIFKNTDTKKALEELDDMNLDEQSKKKQKQMMRNRISAQNSRDRKKAYAQQLEQINEQLVEENSNLRREKQVLLEEISQLKYSESQLLNENQTLKSSMCANCRQSSNQGFTLNHEDTENLIDYGAPAGGFSGLASPILSRFPSGRGIISFLTFAAFVSCVVVMNMPQNNEIALQGPTVPEFLETNRMLEIVDNEPVEQTYPLQPSMTADFPAVNPYMLQNIEPLKNYFNENYELIFKQNLQIIRFLDSKMPVFSTVQTEDLNTQNAVTMYKDPKISNLRKKVPTIISQNLPVIDDTVEDQTVTSTLFCPSAIEFDQTQNRTLGFPNSRVGERLVVDNPNGMTTRRDLNLEKAEYLQLFVPKSRVASVDVRNPTYSYDTLVPTDDNDNSMLEIWCKVFFVRELNSAL